ncbi:hypothetical protein [Paenarthrobacter nitroguajacolicus]|uniref:hypothetical protein n=1 Tax=Paenarthrobacter nitroguajacolicus TaxID=211146 RepID=UPI00248CF46A|nr:hypothetical protein [Paenarthrobacter nitroguajacolicus]MDI2034603.1 hypothetical protein [Paenarthrobacter nitroguajacolicus]
MSFYLPPLLILGPAIGAVLVYLFLRVQVWSKPDAKSVESHGLWVGIIGWMASSLQGAMNSGIIRADPTASNAPFTSEGLFSALAWPIAAALAAHALGQWSYPAPKAPRRYAELTVRRIRDFLPRKLAWVTALIFAYAAVAIATVATQPAYSAVLPTPSPPSPEGTTVYTGHGQDGRIAGSELAGWLGSGLAVLAIGTWMVLLLIARRRQLETLDGEDNRALRAIAANRLLRTVATIAAGLASIAGNFSALPEPGATWQSSWFNVLGLVNMAVLLVMWWWRVPVLPSLLITRKATSGTALRADPRTHGAAKLSVSLGAVLGVAGALPLLTLVFWFGFIPVEGRGLLAPAIVVSVSAALVLLTIAAGELLIARNHGAPEAPLQWPRQAVSKGLLTFTIVSAAVFAVTIVMTGTAQALQYGPPTWPAYLLLTLGVGVVGAAAILAARRRRGLPEPEHSGGLDAALRAISMYRVVRTLAAFLLAQAAVMLLGNAEAWGTLFPAFNQLGPSPVYMAGVVLAVAAVAAAVTPVRSLFRDIPRDEHTQQEERAQ